VELPRLAPTTVALLSIADASPAAVEQELDRLANSAMPAAGTMLRVEQNEMRMKRCTKNRFVKAVANAGHLGSES